MSGMKAVRLKQAKDEIHRARSQFERSVAKECPAGSPIRWLRGTSSSIQYGTVIWTAGERIKVRNGATGKEYVIGLYDVLQAAGLNP